MFVQVLVAISTMFSGSEVEVILDSRIQRRPEILDSRPQSNHLLKQYLLTLGQTGNPRSAQEVLSFTELEGFQDLALLAYGEIEGASAEALLSKWPGISKSSQVAFAEAFSKSSPDQSAVEQFLKLWKGFSQKNKNWSMYSLWRLASKELEQEAKDVLDIEKKAKSGGYVYYLFRSRAEVDPKLLVRCAKTYKSAPQTLIHLTRIKAGSSSPQWLSVLKELCRHQDWRIRVNGLNALSGLDPEAGLEEGLRLLEDPNPNVIKTAITVLAKSQKDIIKQQLKSRWNVLSDSQTQTLLTHWKGPERQDLFNQIDAWERSRSQWRQLHWIRLAGTLLQTQKEKGSGTPSPDSFLSSIGQKLNRLSREGTSAQKALSLRASVHHEDGPDNSLLKQNLFEGDPYVMAAVMDVLGQLKREELPLPPRSFKKLVSKQYEVSDFQYAYLDALESLLDETQAAEEINRLTGHPDYLVRLKALSKKKEPDIQLRQSVLDPGWEHDLPKELKQLAQGYLTAKSDVIWALETTKGVIQIQLDVSLAPITCANMVYLSQKGYFDFMAVHRVVPNFVVQAGDPRGDGSGGPGYAIPCEINPLRFKRGSVGMALAGKDTGGSQFFICHSEQPHLDGGYTVFGKVVSGMKVVDRIEEGDLILRARVQ